METDGDSAYFGCAGFLLSYAFVCEQSGHADNPQVDYRQYPDQNGIKGHDSPSVYLSDLPKLRHKPTRLRDAGCWMLDAGCSEVEIPFLAGTRT